MFRKKTAFYLCGLSSNERKRLCNVLKENHCRPTENLRDADYFVIGEGAEDEEICNARAAGKTIIEPREVRGVLENVNRQVLVIEKEISEESLKKIRKRTWQILFMALLISAGIIAVFMAGVLSHGCVAEPRQLTREQEEKYFYRASGSNVFHMHNCKHIRNCHDLTRATRKDFEEAGLSPCRTCLPHLQPRRPAEDR